MKPSVYIESSVISYLTARPSGDLVIAANQKLTADWWQNSKHRFELFISPLVMKEISAGDSDAANARITAVRDIPVLEMGAEAVTMAKAIITEGSMPKKAAEDALHIALATYAGLDYLLTWNCTHIANAEIRKSINKVVRGFNLQCPIICTPQELMGPGGKNA